MKGWVGGWVRQSRVGRLGVWMGVQRALVGIDICG